MKLKDLEIQNGEYVIYEYAVELQEDYSDRKMMFGDMQVMKRQKMWQKE